MKRRSTIAAVYTFTALSASAAFATPTLTTLATFTGTANGATPVAGLFADASGNLYGTTSGGGSNGFGTVFKVAAGSHTLSTLVAFNYSNGSGPEDVLIADSSGNLYGTTVEGGSGAEGTVFKVAAGTNTLSTLAAFNSSTGTGTNPTAGLLSDASGNLYGTTVEGGSSSRGTVFKVAAGANTLSTLATFTGANGELPGGALLADALGNLYGTTEGNVSTIGGTVFKIAAGTNTLSTLATLTIGANPDTALIADASGNMYGTTYDGGSSGDGTVFKIADGTNALTTLATFTGTGTIGSEPEGGLIADASGNLYGTTFKGGSSGDGTIFKIAAGTDTLTTLYSFTGTGTVGAEPFAGLIADGSGNLYGTTDEGGSSNDGTVFELSGTGFAVPEPGSLTLLGVGCVALLGRRRRQG